jgi:DNA-binding transcriptional ArsR family regulator
MPEILDKETIKALGTDTRQDIMKILAKRPYTASEIAKITKKHVTTVTEHLNVLEKTGLVRKKESTNKWVYYELTDKGEHLFKPQFYSWVVAFCISAVLVFVGFIRIFRFESSYMASPMAREALKTTAGGAVAPMSESAAQIAQAAAVDYLGVGLIVLGIAGLSFLVYKKYFASRVIAVAN